MELSRFSSVPIWRRFCGLLRLSRFISDRLNELRCQILLSELNVLERKPIKPNKVIRQKSKSIFNLCGFVAAVTSMPLL